MQMIFSMLSLVAIVGFVVWWSMREIPPPLPQVDTQKETTGGDSVLDSLEKAKQAKEILEGKTSTSLDLSNQNLEKTPEYVFGKTNLENLDLSHNKLTGSLQAEIRLLRDLRSLDLSNNKFTGVPAEVGQLKNLEVLDLSNNLLIGLPHELGNLSNLKVLRLTGNNYSETDLEIIKKTLPASTIIETR